MVEIINTDAEGRLGRDMMWDAQERRARWAWSIW